MNEHSGHQHDQRFGQNPHTRRATPNPIVESLRWALETRSDPSLATANWLAHDMDQRYRSVLALLTDPGVPLRTLRLAKDVFKNMRVLGESSADRRLGARLYLASIAAALVHHDERISSQSDQAFRESLQHMLDDESVPKPLRNLAGSALNRLGSAQPL